MFDRIVCDPEILSGSTPEEIVAEYDHLTVEDIQQALRYAAASIHDSVVLHAKVAS